MPAQPAILSDVPAHASFLFLDRAHGADPAAAVRSLGASAHPDWACVGIGTSLLRSLSCEIGGMRPLPALQGVGVPTPTTPTDLVVRIAGADPGAVLHRERTLLSGLAQFGVTDRVAGFQYGDNRDLSGYIDGTENPEGSRAAATALRAAGPAGVVGSSVLVVQRWVHDLRAFDGLGRAGQDAAIGRDLESNEELDDVPESAHVKRTAQEDFDPEAFIVRRSMPWRDARGAGLVFVSFSATMDPFEAQLRRMVGLDDGVVDALYSFTRPVTGGAWWCPPTVEGRLDVRACLPR